MSTRTFSEREAADLFRRAAELQAAQAHPETPGLTLDELERAGRAAGIEPAFLHQALRQPTSASTHEPTRYLGRRTSVQRRRFVPHGIDEDTWGRIVLDLRDGLGGQGENETLGGIHQWRRSPLHVVAEPADGGTLLEAQASWHKEFAGATLATLIGVVFIIGMAAMMLFEDKPEGAILMGVLSLFMLIPYAFAYRGYYHKADRIGAKFDAVLDRAAQRLADAAEPSAAEATASEPPAQAEPRIALDDDAPRQDAASRASRVRS